MFSIIQITRSTPLRMTILEDIMYYLTVEGNFSSAHQLRGYKGKCENLHGHNWKVILTVRGEKLNSIGILVDFNELKAMLRQILDSLDHINLNDHNLFQKENPSSENIARRIFQEISALSAARGLADIYTDSVTVYESGTSRCTYKES
jgi:6-pyruvoyltetrahydropterin/6-carboxytetrahydropterin synthase